MKADHRFYKLHPKLQKDLASWAMDAELQKLAKRLAEQKDAGQYLDTLAEVFMARRLRQAGFLLRVEVEKCDLEARHNGLEVYLHIKRLNLGAAFQRQFDLANRLHDLEQLSIPLCISVGWNHDLTDSEMQVVYSQAKSWLPTASVGNILASWIPGVENLEELTFSSNLGKNAFNLACRHPRSSCRITSGFRGK